MGISKKTAGLAVGKAIGLALASPAFAQSSAIAPAAIKAPSDIIVIARSVDGRLQHVPISITVFNQQQLLDKNVTDATNLANIKRRSRANMTSARMTRRLRSAVSSRTSEFRWSERSSAMS